MNYRRVDREAVLSLLPDYIFFEGTGKPGFSKEIPLQQERRAVRIFIGKGGL